MTKKTITDYVLELIRFESGAGYMSGWLEELRLDFTPLLSRQIKHLLSGGSIIILTDQKREWLALHLLSHTNAPDARRPYAPIFELGYLKTLATTAPALINDVLSASMKRHAFWYIGGESELKNMAMSQENSFYWLLGEQLSGALTLNIADRFLDYKLLQLSRIFTSTLHQALSNKIHLDV